MNIFSKTAKSWLSQLILPAIFLGFSGMASAKVFITNQSDREVKFSVTDSQKKYNGIIQSSAQDMVFGLGWLTGSVTFEDRSNGKTVELDANESCEVIVHDNDAIRASGQCK